MARECISDQGGNVNGTTNPDRRSFLKKLIPWGALGVATGFIASREGTRRSVANLFSVENWRRIGNDISGGDSNFSYRRHKERVALQEKIAEAFIPAGYEIIVVDREDSGYGVQVYPVDLRNASEISQDIDDACFSRMIGCISRVMNSEENSSQVTPVTLHFNLPTSRLTNKSIGVIERLKSEGLEVVGFILGNEEFDDIDNLPNLPRLKYVTLPGISTDSLPAILEKAPNIRDINTGVGDGENLPKDMADILRDLGRESIVVNGSRYRI